ncbi:MAG: SAM-dependent methyltransferase [Bacteroidetes bacterium]|nr:SAM-dependent methyltransferase [Bacteroidota bacterium]
MITTPDRPAALFAKDERAAFDAMVHAQFIAFAPYVFQASVLLRDKGILAEIEQCNRHKAPATLACIVTATGMSQYAVRVLLEAGLGIGLLFRIDEDYFLTKAGHFFLNDGMTRVNTNFMRDICYDGAQDLAASLDEGRPVGLRHLNPEWKTIYPYISKLEPAAKNSWFEFDHYYSDNAFPEVLPIVFANKPHNILDIGGNTGKFTLQCLNYDPDVQLGIYDLPGQIAVAEENIAQEGFSPRASFFAGNILDEKTVLPTGFQLIWMSQFLDCFSDLEIQDILKKCFAALGAEGRVFILETFWDRQKFEASAFSLQMTSLYFTTMANGNSQMYDSAVFLKLCEHAGFVVEDISDQIGMAHSLVTLRKP